MSLERIDKILSHEGFGSRKAIKKLIKQKAVSVNGKLIDDSSISVNADTDKISVFDEELDIKKNLYMMMNKKSGYISANKDGLHPTVFDLLDEKYKTKYLTEKLHIVGRLDMDTEGFLFFTTDGILTHKIISPKSNIPKTYFVRLKKSETQESAKIITEKFYKGIHIEREDNDPCADCKSADIKWLNEIEAELTITEGKYHQVKRMFKAVGNEVIYLKRIAIGNLKLDNNLKLGETKELTSEETALILNAK